jgi:hypothetical protein
MSEIFEEYAKIALERGLIKEAQNESKKPNPRYDSVDLEAMEMLYGIKPNDEEDHIVEQAHPESVVVAPAYDRANGLVENLLERQDIMTGIALKPNDGKLVQRRYVVAHNDLVNELLKTAFMLDKKGQEDLMKLADNCSGRLNKEAEINKTAWAWLVKALPYIWTGVKWVGTALAVSSAVNNHVNSSQGLSNDIDNALKQMSEANLGEAFDSLEDALSDLGTTAETATVYRQGLSDILAEAEDGVSPDSASLSTGQYDEELLSFFHSYLKECRSAKKLARKGIKDANRTLQEDSESWGDVLEPVKQIYRMIEPSEGGDVPKALERFLNRTARDGSLDVEILNIQDDIQSVKTLAAKNKEVAGLVSEQSDEAEGLTEDLMGS